MKIFLQRTVTIVVAVVIVAVVGGLLFFMGKAAWITPIIISNIVNWLALVMGGLLVIAVVITVVIVLGVMAKEKIIEQPAAQQVTQTTVTQVAQSQQRKAFTHRHAKRIAAQSAQRFAPVAAQPVDTSRNTSAQKSQLYRPPTNAVTQPQNVTVLDVKDQEILRATDDLISQGVAPTGEEIEKLTGIPARTVQYRVSRMKGK